MCIFYETSHYLLQVEVNSLALTDSCSFNYNISAYTEEVLSAKSKFNCLAIDATIYKHYACEVLSPTENSVYWLPLSVFSQCIQL